MDKILFICEGAKTEKLFCNLIIDKYFIQRQKQKEFVAFGTNIYGLYDELSKDEGLDIVQLVKEKAKAKKDMDNYNKLESGGFSEVYLIFDFDFHASQYDYEKISSMIDFFDNETEHGKLYINYPMIESFKHFKELPDPAFNTYKVDKAGCLTYKKLIGNVSKIVHFSDITEEILGIIIKQNLDKYSMMINTDIENYNLYIQKFSQRLLLTVQIESICKEGSIFVLNSALFWGIDYFGKPKFDEYNSISIKEDCCKIG